MTAARQLDARRKRALYRASHRGTKEMDWLLGRFAEAQLAAMSERELEAFETLLALPDPDLENWIMQPGDSPAGSASELGDLIDQMRSFHGVGN